MSLREYIFWNFLILSCLFGCSCSPGWSDSGSFDRTLRIGTYNVENLFDNVDDPHKSDDPATSEEQFAALATIIMAVDCDILALQEVENLDILRAFNDVYLRGMYSEIVLVEGNDPRGIDVAFLSKYEFSDVRSYRDREIPDPMTGHNIRFSRDLLVVSWEDYSGREWNLVTTHLKSGGSSADRARRTLQAEEIAEICREDGLVSFLGNGYAVLLGDLNAEPWSDDLESLREVPFSDPARDLPYRFTHVSGKVLDYILLSPDADKRYIIGSYTIYRDVPSETASDHFLVYLDLSL